MSFEVILPFLRPIEHLIRDGEISEIMVNYIARRPISSAALRTEGLIRLPRRSTGLTRTTPPFGRASSPILVHVAVVTAYPNR